MSEPLNPLEICAALNIPLDDKGNVRCPCGAHEHGDRNPSCNPSLKYGFRCWKTQQNITSVDFVMKSKNWSKKEAVDLIYGGAKGDFKIEPEVLTPEQCYDKDWDIEVDDAFIARCSQQADGNYLICYGDLAVARYKTDGTNKRMTFMHLNDKGRYCRKKGARYDRAFCGATGGLPAMRELSEADKIDGARVLVVEGEKCIAEARKFIARKGFKAVVTGWSGGVANSHLTDLSPLTKAERVIVWPDKDEAGKTLIDAIAGLSIPFFVVSPPDEAPEKYDIADCLIDTKDGEALAAALIKAAKPYEYPAQPKPKPDIKPNEALKPKNKGKDKPKAEPVEIDLTKYVADSYEGAVEYMNKRFFAMMYGGECHVGELDDDGYAQGKFINGQYKGVMKRLRRYEQFAKFNGNLKYIYAVNKDDDGNITSFKEGKVVQAWWESKQRLGFTGYTFAPTKPAPPPQSPVLTAFEEEKYLNGWCGLAIQPHPNWRDADAESLELLEMWKGHMLEVWANDDKEKYNFIIQWFAKLLAFPDELPGVAMYIIGEKGVGKNVAADIFLQIFGDEHSAVVVGSQALTDQFNIRFMGVKYCVANEVSFQEGGIKSRMKSMVTEKACEYNGKYLQPEKQDNLMGICMLTNSDTGLPAGGDGGGERRYFVNRCKSAALLTAKQVARTTALAIATKGRDQEKFRKFAAVLSAWLIEQAIPGVLLEKLNPHTPEERENVEQENAKVSIGLTEWTEDLITGGGKLVLHEDNGDRRDLNTTGLLDLLGVSEPCYAPKDIYTQARDNRSAFRQFVKHMRLAYFKASYDRNGRGKRISDEEFKSRLRQYISHDLWQRAFKENRVPSLWLICVAYARKVEKEIPDAQSKYNAMMAEAKAAGYTGETPEFDNANKVFVEYCNGTYTTSEW